MAAHPGDTAAAPDPDNGDFHALGVRIVAAQAQAPVKARLGNLPLYCGYWWDGDIGLYHVRHRVYRPEWGKWVQRDPLGYAAGWNLYEYVGGEPGRGVDPSGLAPENDERNYKPSGNWLLDFLRSMFIGKGSPSLGEGIERARREAAENAHDTKKLSSSGANDALVQIWLDLGKLQDAFPEAADLAQQALFETLGGGVSGSIGAAVEISKGIAKVLIHIQDAGGATAALLPFIFQYRNGEREVIAASYSLLKRSGMVKVGEQAAHLNQVAAFLNHIAGWGGSESRMLAIPLKGSIQEVGSEHWLFHMSLEKFWESFRSSTLRPTIGQYLDALREALKATGRFSSNEIDALVEAAREEVHAAGATESTLFKDLPGRTPCTKP